MERLNELLALPLFRNSLFDSTVALAISTALFLVCVLVRRVARRYYARLRQTAEIEWAEIPAHVLSQTPALSFLILSLCAGLGTLVLGEKAAQVVGSVATITAFVQVGLWAGAAAALLLERRRRRAMSTDRAVASSLGIVGFLVRTAIWALIVLLVLDNLGVDVTAMVAGLGIGGVAIALASQNILGDLFASLSITFDRPFVVGDFLIIDDFLGSVEYIGVKSTRLRSLSGEQIIMANAELLKARIRNYGRMAERRVVFALNVTYDTAADMLERIPQEVRRIVEAQQDTRFDRSHFASYGAHSLDFETVYYVLSADYNRYMDIQQAINLEIYRTFEGLGIEFAYPTQTLYLSRIPKQGAVARAADASPATSAAVRARGAHDRPQSRQRT